MPRAQEKPSIKKLAPDRIKECPVIVNGRPCGIQTFRIGTLDTIPSFDEYKCAKGHRTYYPSENEKLKSAENVQKRMKDRPRVYFVTRDPPERPTLTESLFEIGSFLEDRKMTRQEIERRINELAREYVETPDKKTGEEFMNWRVNLRSWRRVPTTKSPFYSSSLRSDFRPPTLCTVLNRGLELHVGTQR
jgi:hypothetical protein